MAYPVILGGDHAEFEAEWAASGRPDSVRPDWPLPSFDAQDWAAAFCKIATNLGYKDADGKPIDEGWMITWFANALMRGYDHRSAEAGLLVLALEQIAEGTTDLVPPYRAIDRNQMRDIALAAIGGHRLRDA